mmetsp:Transcript_24927/g.46579  ORF Transcript_24927/g.46579 Transcript_24927/m.46579 type:complete len:273 (+) Transcript_24927:469-1287(+)
MAVRCLSLALLTWMSLNFTSSPTFNSGTSLGEPSAASFTSFGLNKRRSASLSVLSSPEFLDVSKECTSARTGRNSASYAMRQGSYSAYVASPALTRTGSPGRHRDFFDLKSCGWLWKLSFLTILLSHLKGFVKCTHQPKAKAFFAFDSPSALVFPPRSLLVLPHARSTRPWRRTSTAASSLTMSGVGLLLDPDFLLSIFIVFGGSGATLLTPLLLTFSTVERSRALRSSSTPIFLFLIFGNVSRTSRATNPCWPFLIFFRRNSSVTMFSSEK